MKRLIILAGLAACACLPVRAQLATAHFPAEAKWVLHLDLKALNGSPMGAFVRQSLDAGAQRGLASLQAMSGINLTNDIDSLVVCGMGDLQAGGVLYAYGRFDVARLTAVAGGAKAFQNKALGERSLLSWSDKGKRTSLCFIDPTLAILARDERLVQDAVARVEGAAGRMGKACPYAQVLSHTPGRFLALQANNVAALAGANPQLQMLKQAEAVLLEVGQLSETNGVACALALKAPSKDVATQVSQAAQGLQALFLLQAAQNPEAAQLAQGMKIALREEIVTVDLKLPEASLQKMVQVRVEQRQAAVEARRAARKAAGGHAAEEGEGEAEKKPERPAF